NWRGDASGHRRPARSAQQRAELGLDRLHVAFSAPAFRRIRIRVTLRAPVQSVEGADYRDGSDRVVVLDMGISAVAEAPPQASRYGGRTTMNTRLLAIGVL